MHAISNHQSAPISSQCTLNQNRTPDGTLRSCLARASCTHYATLRFDMPGNGVGRQAGKQIAAFLKACGNGYDTTSIRRQEGLCIAATLRKQERRVSFSL